MNGGQTNTSPTAAVVLFVAVIHIAWWGLGDQIVAHGGLADGDSFTRLLRVEQMAETQNWVDNTVPGINAPYGATTHWTRLFDMVLLVLALPLIPGLGLKMALYWAGVLVSPLIHMTLAATLVWATRPFLGHQGGHLAGALTAAQFGILAFAIVGRADHHLMFLLFAAMTLGCLSRSLGDPSGGRHFAKGGGACLAFGIWEGPEFLLFLVICLVVCGLPWLLGEDGARRRNRWLAQGLLVGLAATTLAERGLSGLTEIEYDRISIVHVCLGFLLFLFWRAVDHLHRAGWTLDRTASRLTAALAGGAVTGATLWILFPKIFSNPLDDADPDIFPIYAQISEYAAVTEPGKLLVFFGGAILAVPWVLWCLHRERNSLRKWSWALVAAALCIYLALGVSWIRWSMYAALFTALILADLMCRADMAISARYSFPARLPLKVLVLFVIAVGPLMLAAAIRHAEKTPGEREAKLEASCPLREMTGFLNAPPWSEGRHIIVASANFGPEILYRTGQGVVATVHHRNVDGILDGHRVLAARSESAARNIIKRRGIDLLLLCPDSENDAYFLLNDTPSLLYRRLERGDIPYWLKPVELPDALSKTFKLFQVR